MNAMFGIGIVSGIIYGILVDGTYLKIYFGVMLVYTIVFTNLMINKKHYTLRKNINVTSWGCNNFSRFVSYIIYDYFIAPSDPSAYMPVDYDMTNALKYLKKLK